MSTRVLIPNRFSLQMANFVTSRELLCEGGVKRLAGAECDPHAADKQRDEEDVVGP